MAANRVYTLEKKLKIVFEDMSDTISVADLCRKYDLKPARFSYWKDHLLDSAPEIFENLGRKVDEERIRGEKDKEIAGLNATIAKGVQENLAIQKRLECYGSGSISYYIAANYDYISLSWNAHAVSVHDSKTFPDMVKQIPEDSIIIFDRGYSSADNVRLNENRKYIGALVLSDHSDLLDLPMGEDSFIETEKTVYGGKHRIISLIKKFRKTYVRTRNIIESSNSDSMERAMSYL